VCKQLLLLIGQHLPVRQGDLAGQEEADLFEVLDVARELRAGLGLGDHAVPPTLMAAARRRCAAATASWARTSSSASKFAALPVSWRARVALLGWSCMALSLASRCATVALQVMCAGRVDRCHAQAAAGAFQP